VTEVQRPLAIGEDTAENVYSYRCGLRQASKVRGSELPSAPGSSMISIPVSARLGQVMADLHSAHLLSDHLEKV
jgi:hypothetical protein